MGKTLVMYFEVIVQLRNTLDSKKNLRGKFIGAGSSYTSLKSFVSEKLKKAYPDYTQDIKLRWLKDVDGLFLENLDKNDLTES